MQEQELTNQINNAYYQQDDHFEQCTLISRHIPLGQLPSEERTRLAALIENSTNLLLSITLADEHGKTQQFSSSADFNIENYTTWHLHAIYFDHNAALIWISLYFRDELADVYKECVSKQSPFNQMNGLLLLVGLVITIGLIFYFPDLPKWLSKTLLIIDIAIVLKFIQDIWAHFVSPPHPSNNNVLELAAYFVPKLEEYAMQHLSLDIAQETE